MQVDISKDNRALQKLRRETERAKRALSSQHQVMLFISYTFPPKHAAPPGTAILSFSRQVC